MFKEDETQYCPMCQEWAEKYEKLKQENEELINRLQTIDDEILTVEITQKDYDKYKKYKQSLEEIKKETHRLFYELNPIYGYNNSNHFEFLAKFVMKKTDEVLNDRD